MWPDFEKLYLTQNMRVQDGGINTQYSNWLATLSYDEKLYGAMHLPPYIRTTKDPKEFKDTLYKDADLKNPGPDSFTDRAILTTRNDSVNALNSTIAASLVGEEKIYYSQDSVDTKDSMDTTNYSTEFLRSVKTDDLPLGKLSLKVDMPVML